MNRVNILNAELLKTAGYNSKCRYYYNKFGSLYIGDNTNKRFEYSQYYSAPNLFDVLSWFRNEKNINIVILSDDYITWTYYIIKKGNNLKNSIKEILSGEYNNVLNDAIYNTLKIII